LEVMSSKSQLDPSIISTIMKSLDDRPVQTIEELDPESRFYSFEKLKEIVLANNDGFIVSDDIQSIAKKKVEFAGILKESEELMAKGFFKEAGTGKE